MDIIIFAALAVYIFVKLNKQLGKIDDEERQRIQENIAKQKQEFVKMAQQQGQQVKSEEKLVVGSSSTEDQKLFDGDSEDLVHLDQDNKDNLQLILSQSKIDYKFFISGAKSAFESVVKAFSDDKIEDVKFLLAPKVSKGFEDVIAERKNQQQKLFTNIISIDSAQIISALVADGEALIMVKFISSQINYITNDQGKVIEGKKTQINQSNDIWTFKRKLKNNPNPNWLVTSVASG